MPQPANGRSPIISAAARQASSLSVTLGSDDNELKLLIRSESALVVADGATYTQISVIAVMSAARADRLRFTAVGMLVNRRILVRCARTTTVSTPTVAPNHALRLCVMSRATATIKIAADAISHLRFASPAIASATTAGNNPVRNAPSSWLSPKLAVTYGFEEGEKLSRPANATATQ